MQGKIFRIKDTENPATIGFEFIKAHPERWEDFNYEESSIDIQISCHPKIVAEDEKYGQVAYSPVAQFFIRESGTKTTRLILLSPVLMEKDNRILTRVHNGSARYAKGFIPGISDVVIGDDGNPKVDSEGNKIPKPTVKSDKVKEESKETP